MSQADLEAAVMGILRSHPKGITEFALFAALARRGFAAFEREVFADNLRMFRSHFVLFHVLYAMRDRLVLQRQGHLRIEATCIQLTGWEADAEPYASASARAGAKSLAEHDALSDYYLDPSHLESTTEDELGAMLGAFWHQFHEGAHQRGALRIFGLDGSATWDQIKARHRVLVFEHHPDRGGDNARLAEVNAAMRVLKGVRGPGR